jgi:uncharacterized short protein YbdD (DUF466 family)
MAITETRQLPAKFIEDLGVDLGKQIVAQSGIPVVAPGAAGITQLAGESAADFAARQKAGQQFDIRQQSLAGLAPTVAGQDRLQREAQDLAEKGIGSFQPFLTRAQDQATEATRLAGVAESQLGTAGTTLGGVPLGATAFQQDVGQFMSPFQSQVIDATLAEFDRNKAIQEQQIRDQQASLGVLGAGRAGVQLAEFGTGAARERALLQAGLLQQGFGQAQAARQQDIANRFGLGQAQAGIAGAQQGLGAFRSGLGGQQAQLGAQQQALTGRDVSQLGTLGAINQAQQQALTGRDVSQLGTLGAINQAQAQAEADASREAARQAAFLPQQQLDRYAAQVTGLMGGYPGQTQQSFVPNPTPLQTALGIGSTLAGLYLGRKDGGRIGYKEGTDKEGIMQMADMDVLEEEYEKYKFDLLEQRPDATPMSFEEFRRMVLSGQG